MHRFEIYEGRDHGHYTLTLTTPLVKEDGAQVIEGGDVTASSSLTALTSNGLSDGVEIDPSKKIILSTEDADGYYELETSGQAIILRSEVTKQVTKAGYFPQDEVPQTAIEEETTSVENEHSKYYVVQSTLSADVINPDDTTQTVTVSPGYYHEDRSITIEPAVDAVVESSTEADVSVPEDQSERSINSSIIAKSSTQPVSGFYLKAEASSISETEATSAGWVPEDVISTATDQQTKYFSVDQGSAIVTASPHLAASLMIRGVNAIISREDNGIQLAAEGSVSGTIDAQATADDTGFIVHGHPFGHDTVIVDEQLDPEQKFLAGVMMPPPQNGTKTFTLSLPNGPNSMNLFTITVDSNGNTVIE